MSAGPVMRRHARRPSGRTQRGQTLILIFLGSLLLGTATTGGVFGGVAVPQLRAHVREAMSDQAKRAQVDLTLDRIAAEARRDDEQRAQFEGEVFAQLARHDATPAELQALVARGDALRQDMRGRFLDLRFELRGQLTTAQWKTVFEGAAAPVGPSGSSGSTGLVGAMAMN
jgi:hypothetical protein